MLDDITPWAKKTFKHVLSHPPRHWPCNLEKEVRKWEDRYTQALPELSSASRPERRKGSKRMHGVKDAASRFAALARASALTEAAGGCYICQQQLSVRRDDWNWDHIIPRVHGTDTLGKSVTSGNTMPTHRSCNSDKGDRMPTEEELSRARAAYAQAGLRFFDQDPEEFYRKSA